MSEAGRMDGSGAGERLVVFVYGTLKRGYGNHNRLMKGYSSVEEATVVGRLLDLSQTIPILAVPPLNILGWSSASLADDLATQERVLAATPMAPPVAAGSEGWVAVRGELFTFHDNLVERAIRLDLLEGCNPGTRRGNLYDRVLVPVEGASVGAAWVYVVPWDRREDEFTPALDPACWPS